MLKKILITILKNLDDNLEKYIIVVSYTTMAMIIFVEVIRRFLLNEQSPWSTTIPILLFLWLTWFGAAYNIKIRGHLALTEVRARLSYKGQFFCFIGDAVLWIIFAAMIIYFSIDQVKISYDNFAFVDGTDDMMQWWFYMATPLAWILIIIRVIQQLLKDIKTYKNKQPFVFQSISIKESELECTPEESKLKES